MEHQLVGQSPGLNGMTRPAMLALVAQQILLRSHSYPLLIAVDGMPAAGKTTLADELAGYLRSKNHPVVRASVDGFHHPRHIRYRQGIDSPTGYYEDAFNYPALISDLLQSLGSGGDGRYRPEVFDFIADRPIDDNWQYAPPQSKVIVDGVFLFRPELIDHWDIKIFVDTSPEIALNRAKRRDPALLGVEQAVADRYHRRYLPAQELYSQQCRPEQKADMIIYNDYPADPQLHICEYDLH